MKKNLNDQRHFYSYLFMFLGLIFFFLFFRISSAQPTVSSGGQSLPGNVTNIQQASTPLPPAPGGTTGTTAPQNPSVFQVNQGSSGLNTLNPLTPSGTVFSGSGSNLQGGTGFSLPVGQLGGADPLKIPLHTGPNVRATAPPWHQRYVQTNASGLGIGFTSPQAVPAATLFDVNGGLRIYGDATIISGLSVASVFTVANKLKVGSPSIPTNTDANLDVIGKIQSTYLAQSAQVQSPVCVVTGSTTVPDGTLKICSQTPSGSSNGTVNLTSTSIGSYGPEAFSY